MSVVVRKTACTRDCPDACGMLVTVDGHKAIRLQGDPNHPITQGFLCHRTSRFLDRQYSPDRLTEPLLRRGKSDSLQPIAFADAYDLLAEKMLGFREQSGAESILQYRCGGSMGLMKTVGDHFFNRFGPVTTKSGDICSGAGEAAQEIDFGHCDSNDFFDFHHSKTIVLWGKNVFVSSVHLIPELKKARRNGARIVLIDPLSHKTVQLADQYIQPRPGCDAAIALGVARWLFDNGCDDQSAPTYCDNFDQFKSLAESKSLGEWAQIADVKPEAITNLAESYANGPSSILMGWGIQRRRFGASTIRTIDALASIAGNIGKSGGGVSFYFQRRTAFDQSFLDEAPAARKIPEPLLGPGVLAAADPPIRMVYVWGANPVVSLPGSSVVAEALRTREFTVVVDPFLTDTARCADLVIPTTTMLEEHDLLGAYGHHYLADVNPVIEAPQGLSSDHGIFRELSRRVGLAEEFDVSETVWKQRLLAKLESHGISSDEFKRDYPKNPFVSDVAFESRQFQTPSGKINLIDRLPDGMLTLTNSSLRLIAVSTEHAQASQWPRETQVGPCDAILHPSAANGFKEKAEVTLRSSAGTMRVRLRFDASQRRDTIRLAKGGWHSAGRSANDLVSAETTDEGGCAVYYDTVVDIDH